MQSAEPDKLWWTTREIADAELIDMPVTQQGVDKLSKQLIWREQPDLARKRQGRGGGWEYNWQLFPLAARRFLLAQTSADTGPVKKPVLLRAEAWAWFDNLSETIKRKAQSRLGVIQKVFELEQLGQNRFTSVAMIADTAGVSDRTIWNWLSMIEMVQVADYLPYLAPRHKAAQRNDPKAKSSPEFMDRLKADYLRLEAPTFTSSYRRVLRLCKQHNWKVLPERTARRRFNQIVPRVSQIFAREGLIGLERCFPPQKRDRSGMVAMEGVNADCHKIDVFVKWPDGTVNRPQIIAFQDLYSNKMLSWRVDHTPNKVMVMAAFGDLIEDYGIPKHCLFDNGREFANKWLTGGTATRFRYTIREDDPLGVLPQLGIKVHWATPAHGQAKPIERAFRDLADDIAKDPRFAGAYVGNRPDAKPENYQSHAVPIEQFLQVLEDGIEEHNARLGRLTDNALGRSFDETFNESYASTPILKATDEQRRLWLMGQEVKTMNQSHGLVSIHQNRYWSDWMAECAGQKVIVRFDPEDLHAGVYLYALSGEFMGYAECKEKSGFFSLEDAQETARQKSKFKRMHRKLLKETRPMGVDQIAAELDALPRTLPAMVEAKVVSAPFGKGDRKPLVAAPVYKDTQTASEKAEHKVFVADFSASKPKAEPGEETARKTFIRALELERKADAGERIGEAEAAWLKGYQTTAEYCGERMVYEDFGGQSYS
ncbi:MAG: Mu transposase C-terminal domain-containing protein [Amylibacter sp.]|nr:Mu transposase C-terminal domain-containing protein [Amylibacter sp.]